MGLFDFFKRNTKQNEQKLEEGLEKTKKGFFQRLSHAILGKSTIDDEVLDKLEEELLLADVGVNTTIKIIDRIRNRVKKDKYTSTGELEKIMREEISRLMYENNTTYQKDVFNIEPQIEDGKKIPYVIMVVGVNGVGKTTTIGKLAYQFKQANHSVLLGAADTFRAAAVDQLKIWSERVGVPIVDKGMGADPASVAHDTVKMGLEQGYDVVIIDTAGRLQTKVNLMNELSKIRKVMSRFIPQAPHEVLLVLDASTGQNALNQAGEFIKATQVNAIALTKLDGTAKGGVIIGISDQFQIPIKYIGVGEQMPDLQIFDPRTFVDSLFKK
jgi:fused signal recognition particle receptor